MHLFIYLFIYILNVTYLKISTFRNVNWYMELGLAISDKKIIPRKTE
jgi:hypothetical protein